MSNCKCRRSGRKARKRLADEHSPRLPASATEAKPSVDRLAPNYAAGAALHMRADREEQASGGAARDTPSIMLSSTHATRHETTVSGAGRTIRLEGKTTAQFDGGTSQIRNQQVERATDCAGCDERRCLRVTGTLVLNYRVTTQVSLPSVNDYPDLTPCQRRRVQDAIDTVLAPHEQEHVRAFETYNGTVEHPFDLKVCSTEDANTRLQAIHDGDAAQREAAARQRSDALDPFHFDVDLACDDDAGTDAGSGAATPAGAAGPAPSEHQPEADAGGDPAELESAAPADEPTLTEGSP
jgi:hypothetical protein